METADWRSEILTRLPAGTQVLQLDGQFTVTLDELRAAHEATLPAVLAS